MLSLNRELSHSRSQSLRSFWPAAGIERLWEQPFQACAIDEDFVKPDGQNSVISFVISKWLLPELSIPAAGQKDRRLWGREWNYRNSYHWLRENYELKTTFGTNRIRGIGSVIASTITWERRHRTLRERRNICVLSP